MGNRRLGNDLGCSRRSCVRSPRRRNWSRGPYRGGSRRRGSGWFRYYRRRAWVCRRGRFHPRGFRCRFLSLFLCLGSSFRLSLGIRDSVNLLAHFLRDIRRNRTGVRFLFRDTKSGQKINNGFGLDLQLAGQFVDSDLICVAHALRSLLRLGLFRMARFTFILCRCRFRRSLFPR